MNHLYFDIETAPDPERRHLYEEPEPECQCCDVSELPIPYEVCSNGTVPDVESTIKRSSDFGYLALFRAAELATKKRKTALSAIEGRIIETLSPPAKEKENRAALVPEHCRIVAMGLALGDEQPTVYGPHEEREALGDFWRLAKHAKLVCFNGISFDIPVILARSIILGVERTRSIDRRPFGNRDVVDLMRERFGQGERWQSLDALCAAYGLDEGIVDPISGADVPELWETEPGKVIDHVRADIVKTRRLHRAFSGYFTDWIPEPVLAGEEPF